MNGIICDMALLTGLTLKELADELRNDPRVTEVAVDGNIIRVQTMAGSMDIQINNTTSLKPGNC